MNNELLLIYIRKKLIGKSSCIGDTYSIVVYGKTVVYRVVDNGTIDGMISYDTDVSIVDDSMDSSVSIIDTSTVYDNDINKHVYDDIRHYVDIYMDDSILYRYKFNNVLVMGGSRYGKTHTVKMVYRYYSDKSDVCIRYVDIHKHTNIQVRVYHIEHIV